MLLYTIPYSIHLMVSCSLDTAIHKICIDNQFDIFASLYVFLRFYLNYYIILKGFIKPHLKVKWSCQQQRLMHKHPSSRTYKTLHAVLSTAYSIYFIKHSHYYPYFRITDDTLCTTGTTILPYQNEACLLPAATANCLLVFLVYSCGTMMAKPVHPASG